MTPWRPCAAALLAAAAASLFAVGARAAGEDAVWPDAEWARATPAEVGLDEARLLAARDYALSGEGSGMVTRHGKLVLSWGDPAALYDLKSSSKSIGVTLLGLALADGKVRLDDPAVRHHPSFGTPPADNARSGWLEKITLRQLADQTAGFEKPGGYTRLLFPPGSQWHYSDGGPNWLAECLTLAYRQDLADVLTQRVLTPLGIQPQDLRWRQHQYRPHELDGLTRREFGSGFSANVDAMARIGYLYLRGGRWKQQQIIPADFVEQVRRPAPHLIGLPEHEPTHGNASDHYSLLWWNNGDGTLSDVPRDACWSWGLYDSLIVVIPSLDLVAARAGKSWRRTSQEHYDVLRPFLGPLAASAIESSQARAESRGAAPYPPSPVIRELRWAPKETIVRRARGGDNWPLTWADDDALYTAYGDGRGFEPLLPEKLSLGLAKILGQPPDFQGINLRSPGVEARGDDRRGRKASGLLMVDGVLYLLARNADNAQLAWSRDRGATWSWAPWRFTESFGCPTFLNFGRDYSGARDEFVYVYSPDSDSAYTPADRMVLARAPKSRLAERDAWEFFAGLGASGEPQFSGDIGRRGAVFSHPGNCWRGGISFNAPLRRYLWCQVLPASSHPQGPRFAGGFGVYDAPHPWGPWTTVYFTPAWDVGPGETSSFPTKWISGQGCTLHLVFSGDDSFSVRRAEAVLVVP